jgi:hypothetical protein
MWLKTDNYDEILDLYGNYSKNLDFQNEIRLNRYFIKLMKDLSEKKDSFEIQASLILLLNLFFVQNPDSFNNIGKNLTELTSIEKKILIETLKSEIEKNDS